MTSPLFRSITTSLIVLAAAPFTFAADPAPDAAAMDKARMDAAVQFAETVLKHARDVYGEKHTPLFCDALDVDTMKAPEMTYLFRLGGPGPRQGRPYQRVISSNLAFQGNLMRFMAGLSQLTGEPKYKDAYKEVLRYFFAKYQTVSGTLSMGHHRCIDLVEDKYDGDDWPAGDRGHEMKGDSPYYDLFWETDPEATRKMLTGHWNSHIKNWDNMDFTRHGNFRKKLDESIWDRPMGEPVKGIIKGDLTFFGSGMDIVWAGAKLSQLNGDERPRAWAQRLFARYIDCAHPKTGLPPTQFTAARTHGADGVTWPEYALLDAGIGEDLFGSGATALLRLGDNLGEKGAYFRQSVQAYLKAYAKYAYNPKDNTLRCILYDGRDMTPNVIKTKGYAVPEGGMWTPWKPDSSYMLAYAVCYRQSKDKEIWDTLRSMFGGPGNDLGDIGEPGSKSPKLNTATTHSDPLTIFVLVELFRATEDRAYLELARVIGNNAMKRFNPAKGLFIREELQRYVNLNGYEPLAFLTLQAALTGQLDKVPTFDASSLGSPDFTGGQARPTKALPYHPTASFCAPENNVLAMCDEIVPANSKDARVPAFSWHRSRAYQMASVAAVFPDVLKEPATIKGLGDFIAAKNWIGRMVIDSPISYTFEGGQLIGGSDFTLSVLRGNHRWQDVAWTPTTTWTPPATKEWKPTGIYNFIMDIAAGARFTFTGIIGESQQQRSEYYTLWYKGAGLIKNGDGTAVVTYDYGPRYNQKLEDNRAYRLATVVNAGALLVNNAAGSGVSPRSAVQVNGGGTLGGNGAIGNGGTLALVTVHAGGTIAPGSSTGTLTLRDGLTLQDGAKLACELGTAGDLLKVAGGTFTGSGKGGVSVSVADAGGLVVGNTYDLMDWTGATLKGVEVDDFIIDQAGKFTGTFQISGSKLQITITGKTPPAAEGSKPVSNKPTPAVATANKPAAMFTWKNPNGGSWTNGANWSGGEVPNGPAKEWAQYTFEKPRTISGVEVYWLDDDGARLVPESWRVLYRQGGEWKPVEAAGAYGVEKDRFNTVKFRPVETDSLRLEVIVQGSRRADFSAGILEWRVNP